MDNNCILKICDLSVAYGKTKVLKNINFNINSGELIALLHHEAAGAFEVRKNSARKMGEEAGTKLLFPMIMSLGVVIIILIVPAWMTFQV